MLVHTHSAVSSVSVRSAWSWQASTIRKITSRARKRTADYHLLERKRELFIRAAKKLFFLSCSSSSWAVLGFDLSLQISQQVYQLVLIDLTWWHIIAGISTDLELVLSQSDQFVFSNSIHFTRNFDTLLNNSIKTTTIHYYGTTNNYKRKWIS